MSSNRKFAAVLAIALGLLVILVVGAARARARVGASAGEVVETYEIINALTRLMGDVADAETGQRGFILTDDASYLAPYEHALARVDRDAADLRLRDIDATMQGRIDELLALVERRLAILNEMLELRRTHGLTDTVAALRAGGGDETMNALRALVASLIARERERLEERAGRAAEGIARADAIVIGGALCGTLLLCVLVVLLDREMRGTADRERRLREQAAITDGVLTSMDDGVVLADREGNLTLRNEAARRILPSGPLRAGDLFGGDRAMWFRPDGITPIPQDEAPLLVALGGRTADDVECVLRPPDAEPAWFSISSRPLADASGTAAGAVSVFRDITKARRASLALQYANARLQTSVDELRHRNDEMALFGELSQVLHGCGTAAEACVLAAKFLALLCPGGSGAIHLLDATSGHAGRTAAWGRVAHLAYEIRPDECWALRRNATHEVGPERLGLLCGHVASDVSAYACVPLTAPGECLGLLYVERATDAAVTSMPGPGIVEAVAQELSLTLANLHLRDVLLRHSVRDPLTGLRNRRVLDDWFESELSRANRRGSSVGVLLIDVDHLKRFNDSLGHDAGDAMLKALASMLRAAVRTEDLVCRYGGDEFLVILGDTSAEHVTLRAAELCERARELVVHDGTRRLPMVTLSIGVALYPQHADAADALLRAADRALYVAKGDGRDRVTIASAPDQTAPRVAAA